MSRAGEAGAAVPATYGESRCAHHERQPKRVVSMIEAYCTRRSYVAGDRVAVHVSTSAARFDLSVGREARSRAVVLDLTGIAGAEHAIPADVVANGCGWPVAVEFAVPAEWQSGFFRLVLTTPEGEQGETFFILRAASPKSSILWTIETNTWNAYNYFGGASTYTSDLHAYAAGAPRVSFLRPMPKGFLSLPDQPARFATIGAPDPGIPYGRWAEAHGLTMWCGAASWGHWGRALATWLEDEGIAVDYAASSDLEERPDIVNGYKLLLSNGHDEYWSWGMRDTVEGFVARGGNAVFFSGNVAFWQVRLEQDGQQMVAYKSQVDSDPVMGTADERHNSGLWSHRLTKRPENQMTGLTFCRAGYARFAGATPSSAGGYTVYRARHWALEGTGLSYGDQLGASSVIVGYEVDGCALRLQDGLPYPTGEDGTPANFEVIGMAPATLWNRETAPPGMYPEGVLTDLELVCEQVHGDHTPETQARIVHGHAVMGTYTTPAGGTVFASGTTDWAFALGDPQVARITRNLFARLA